MEIGEHGAASQEALTKLQTHIKSVETNKGSDPELIDILKEEMQDACRNANQALQELKKARDDSDERFGLGATRLKA